MFGPERSPERLDQRTSRKRPWGDNDKSSSGGSPWVLYSRLKNFYFILREILSHYKVYVNEVTYSCFFPKILL